MVKQKLTIQAIRSMYTEEKRAFDRNNLWGYFVVRPISYYVTWLFLRLGISANRVTWGSFFIAVAGCLLLATGSYNSIIAGALLVNLWYLLDYVDGNIARYTNSSTNYGRLLDTFTGAAVNVLLIICASIGAFNHPDTCLNSLAQFFSHLNIGKSIILILGVFGGWAYSLRLFVYFILRRGSYFYPVPQSETAVRTKKGALGRSLFILEYITGHSISLLMPILLLATILRFLSAFVLLDVLLFSLASIIAIFQFVKMAKPSGSEEPL